MPIVPLAKNWLESGALKAQTAYWTTKLAGERAAGLPFGGLVRDRVIPREPLFAKTGSRFDGRTEGTGAGEGGMFMILLAAFKTLLPLHGA